MNKETFYTIEKIIDKSIKKHGYKYNYSLVTDAYLFDQISIICPEHGVFTQKVKNHIFGGYGCLECGGKRKKILSEIVQISSLIHNNFYNYSLTNYVNLKSKIDIICPKHGIFSQSVKDHIHLKHGCPTCKNSLGEMKILKFLQENNISFQQEQTFNNCRNINNLRYDFYLPVQNICIEFDGKQHFIPSDFFGGLETFKKLKENDLIKDEYCNDHNIKLVRISYLQINEIESILGKLL